MLLAVSFGAVAMFLAGWVWGSVRVQALDESLLLERAGSSALARLEVTGPARTTEFEVRVPVKVLRFGALALKEELRRLQVRLDHHQERERTLQETMVTAQRISEDMKAAAKKEADAILAGACGYLLKDASIQELLRGIRAAAVGESLISPHIASKVLQRIRASSTQPEIEKTIRSELSEREIEVLKLIANGKDNAQIAAELHISPKTVKNHISNILMKLQMENRIQAAVYAVRSGIV